MELTQWSDLASLDESLRTILIDKLKFTKVTKVQKAVIPLFLSNKDVCVKACTGSGKTLAFVLPLIQQLMGMSKKTFDNSDVIGLILAPSRELAVQIFKVLSEFKDLVPDLGFCYFIGGDKLEYDLQRIREKGCNIVVATIGRAFDLMQKQAFNFRKLEVLIMDEADKLLEDGHNLNLDHILGMLPKQRRTGLFSATMTNKLKSVIRSGMRNPYFVEVRVENKGIFSTSSLTDKDSVFVKEFNAITDEDEFKRQINEISEIPSNLINFYHFLPHQADKLSAFLKFLDQTAPSRIIVFFGTCASVDHHMCTLPYLYDRAKFFKLHGKIDQKKRTKIYAKFKAETMEDDNKHLVLLTTDLSARGIDIPDVDWILQFDPPQESDSFVHRIGRTARAGRSGSSLLFLTEREEAYIPFLQRKQVGLQEFKFQETENKEFEYETMKQKVQQQMKQDRDLIDKSQNAFVSFVRYYKEHHLSFIFPFNMLDLGQAANSFFLFKIPRVKEILGKPVKNFQTDNSVNIMEIPYKDQNKGKQKESLTQKRQEKFDIKAQQKEQQFKQSKQPKKKNVSTSQKKRKKAENDWEEWESLGKEENLAKKLRQGKITKEEFDKLVFTGSDFEDL